MNFLPIILPRLAAIAILNIKVELFVDRVDGYKSFYSVMMNLKIFAKHKYNCMKLFDL